MTALLDLERQPPIKTSSKDEKTIKQTDIQLHSNEARDQVFTKRNLSNHTTQYDNSDYQMHQTNTANDNLLTPFYDTIENKVTLKKTRGHTSSDIMEGKGTGKTQLKDPDKDGEKERLQSSATIEKILPADIRPYDVLCGRHKEVFNNIGNRRFRISISLNLSRYDAAQTKSQKAEVIASVCQNLRKEVGVRFLKKNFGTSKSNRNDYYYTELNATEARKKVGHAIRDMSVARQQVVKNRQAKLETKKRNSNANEEETNETAIDRMDSLNDSLEAMLPYVSHDHEQDHVDAMEPLPLHFDTSEHDEDDIVFASSDEFPSSFQHPPILPPAPYITPSYSFQQSMQYQQQPLPQPPLQQQLYYPSPPIPYNHFHYHYHEHYLASLNRYHFQNYQNPLRNFNHDTQHSKDDPTATNEINIHSV